MMWNHPGLPSFSKNPDKLTADGCKDNHGIDIMNLDNQRAGFEGLDKYWWSLNLVI